MRLSVISQTLNSTGPSWISVFQKIKTSTHVHDALCMLSSKGDTRAFIWHQWTPVWSQNITENGQLLVSKLVLWARSTTLRMKWECKWSFRPLEILDWTISDHHIAGIVALCVCVCVCVGGGGRMKTQTLHTYIFKNTFYNCIVPMGFLQWEIQVAFPWESQPRQSRFPTYGACWMFYCFHNPSNSDMDYRIFNVCTDVHACDYTVKESVLKVDSGRKIHWRTGELKLGWQSAGPMLYQLSYIHNINMY